MRDIEYKKHDHVVSWDKIIMLKKTRGLGLRNLEVMSKACLLKLSWKLGSGDKSLWCEVMRGKYDRQ